MFVRAKRDTQLIDENNKVVEVKAGEVIKTTPSLYRQYMGSEVVETISHKYDDTGIIEIYRVEALMDCCLYTLKGPAVLKKGEQVVINRREMENFTKMKYVTVVPFEVKKKKEEKEVVQEKEVVSDVVEAVQEVAQEKTVSKSKKK